ncbi:armadillo-type protein [Mycena latifolia]|nr:armadillo-type protein [Mycena latifolia]
MPPLTRQQTFQSALSWWSDSNPPGPTINLHAAAKPLMKLMYHQAALGFVKRNRGVALSRETVEIYLSYVLYGDYRLVRTPSNSSDSWTYVSTSTKLVILEELKTRARSEEDARVLIHSDMVDAILQLLRSSSDNMSSQLRGSSAAILKNVASHSKSTSAAVIEPLEALLRQVDDSELNDIGLVSEFMSEIADSQASAFVERTRGVPLMSETVEIYSSYLSWKYVSISTKIAILEELATRAGSEDDALVLIHSNMVDTILQLLQSVSYYMRSQLIWRSGAILRNVASHTKSSSAAVIEPLMALLRQVSDGDMKDVARMFELLMYIADSPVGAEGVMAANALPYLLDGLGSPSSPVRGAACYLTCKLAGHQSTAAAVIDLNPCKQLVAISRQVLDHVPKWFTSPDHWMRRSACRLLEKLARHKSTAAAVMDLELCESDPDDDLALSTLEALASIANWPTGAEAVVAAKALDHLTKILVSRWAYMREDACWLLAALAQHESTAQAVARAVPRERLAALLRDKDEDVRESAGKALQAVDPGFPRADSDALELSTFITESGKKLSAHISDYDPHNPRNLHNYCGPAGNRKSARVMFTILTIILRVAILYKALSALIRSYDEYLIL